MVRLSTIIGRAIVSGGNRSVGDISSAQFVNPNIRRQIFLSVIDERAVRGHR